MGKGHLVATAMAGVAVAAAMPACGEEPADTRASREVGDGAQQECVALWNGPDNARPRAVLNRAAVAVPGIAATTRQGQSLARRALLLRYDGPPLEDVGVGEAGVNASGGECMVAHVSKVLFLHTGGAWHQVGYSPGLAFEGIPQRAASAPNAVITIRKQPGSAVEPGRIALVHANDPTRE